MLDERLIRALHVQALRHTSCTPNTSRTSCSRPRRSGPSCEGAYDGDVTFAELAEHGDLGLGTLNASTAR